MSDKPAVSVVIPAMDESKYIDRCISALSNQSFKDFEVIVVFLGTDDTDAKCQRAGWKVVKQTTKGVSNGRRQGFAEARGEIIASTDADSAPDEHWLENIVASLKDERSVGVYGPTYLFPSSWDYRLADILGIGFQLANRWLGKDHLFGMNFAVKRWAYEKCGGFDPKRITAEDVDLGFRISKYGHIKFSLGIKVFTSDRRLKHQGALRFTLRHIRNYLSMTLLGKSGTDFPPIR